MASAPTPPDSGIHSWRAYYPDAEYNSANVSWDGLPGSGVQVIVIYYHAWASDPPVGMPMRYRRLLDGDDFYYYDRTTGTMESTNQRNKIPKTAVYLTGLEIDDPTFQQIKHRAFNAYHPPQPQ